MEPKEINIKLEGKWLEGFNQMKERLKMEFTNEHLSGFLLAGMFSFLEFCEEDRVYKMLEVIAKKAGESALPDIGKINEN